MTNAEGRGNRAESDDRPSTLWLVVASSWLLLVLVPNGVMAWMAFGILAVIGRRRSWGIAAAVYGVLAIVLDQVPDPAGGILQGTLFLVILVHALVVNPTWLTLLRARRENGLTIFGNPPGGRRRPAGPAGPRQRAAEVPKEAEKLLSGKGTSRNDYLDDTPDAPRRPPRSRRKRGAASAPDPRRAASAEPAELVDVNTANQRALSRLTGMDRAVAKAVIADRAKRGGYSSLEDFGAAAGLKPHEIVRLRAEAFCSARPRAARSFGRRVDY